MADQLASWAVDRLASKRSQLLSIFTSEVFFVDNVSAPASARSSTSSHVESGRLDVGASPLSTRNAQVSSGVAGGSDLPATMATLYRPIAAELMDVERRFSLELQSRYESLMPVLCHGTQLGGKRLRPAMLLLAGASCGELCEDHITMGVVVEMVHTATLIHDDVLDEAQTRRHVETINARWNDHTSILLGDYLFAQSFRLAATLPSTEACRWVGEAARLVCEGELRQVLGRDWIDLDEETYFEMIRGKTAELCRVATQLGARLSGADDAIVDALANYGCAVGIAFQIADDYLDLWGDSGKVGKTLGTDLAQGKMTLPIIRLLSTVGESERRRLSAILAGPSEGRYDGIRDALERSDAAEYARSVAIRFRDQALGELRKLPATLAKTSLTRIADFATDRSF